MDNGRNRNNYDIHSAELHMEFDSPDIDITSNINTKEKENIQKNMKIDTTIWESKTRMKARIKNLATMVASISAVNLFYTLAQKSWIIAGINLLFFASVLPIFMSLTKHEKEPPKQNDTQPN